MLTIKDIADLSIVFENVYDLTYFRAMIAQVGPHVAKKKRVLMTDRERVAKAKSKMSRS